MTNDQEIIASVEASLDHIARLRSRIAEMEKLAAQAEEQIAHRVGAAYRSGLLGVGKTVEIYYAYREATRRASGFAMRWDSSVPISSQRCGLYRDQIAAGHNPDSVEWQGPYPLDGAYCPGPDFDVVYVLYDADLKPCYVGSTSHLKNRLRAHRRDKDFVYWRAYRYRGRDEARAMETRLLRELKPYLNKRAAA